MNKTQETILDAIEEELLSEIENDDDDGIELEIEAGRFGRKKEGKKH